MPLSTSGPEAPRPTRVLFVCTHNSARSIMAEALLRVRGGPGFAVYSAGTERTEVQPLTFRVLEEAGVPTEGLRSKSVEEFLGERFDYVVTVCDSARESCPTFPGEGQRLHWSLTDPSSAGGNEAERLTVFREVLAHISELIDRFIKDSLQSSNDW